MSYRKVMKIMLQENQDFFKGKFQDAPVVQKNKRFLNEAIEAGPRIDAILKGFPPSNRICCWTPHTAHLAYGEAKCLECKKVATHSKEAKGYWLYYCGFHAPNDAKCFCNNKKK